MVNKLPLLWLACVVLTLGSCKKNDPDPVSTTSTSSGSTNQLKNPEGTMTVEIDGKSIDFGRSTGSSQLRASASTSGYSYNLYASQTESNYDLRSISISFATTSEKPDVNSLKGIHKSSDKVNGIGKSVSIGYTYYYYDQRQEKTGYLTENCTVEVTSTTAPYIEGTFTAETPLTGTAPVTIKKGTFKIKYQ